MIFGNPYEFAVLIQEIPEWGGDSYRNGLFHFIIDGEMFPEQISTACLSSELNKFNSSNALISLPENCEIFHKTKEDAFFCMLCLAYPDYRNDPVDDLGEYENIFTYKVSNLNAQDCGCYIFCVRSGDIVRVLGAKVQEQLVNGDGTRSWRRIPQIKVFEAIVPVAAIQHVVRQVNDYYLLISVA